MFRRSISLWSLKKKTTTMMPIFFHMPSVTYLLEATTGISLSTIKPTMMSIKKGTFVSYIFL